MRDIKLIAADMDHTLLTEDGSLPPGFEELVRRLDRAGIRFAIASGRPMYTLEAFFPDMLDVLVFISDNGAAVGYKGERLFVDRMSPDHCRELTRFTERKTDGSAVICGLDGAYIAKKDELHRSFFEIFFAKMHFVDDLETVTAPANKFTGFFPQRNSEKWYHELFAPQYGARFSVTVGDAYWIDLMNTGINKGTALEWLGERWDIAPQQMMAFGDTYNDKEMLQVAGYSYIMENAAADMRQYAKYVAPSNEDYGVLQIVRQLLGQE